MGTLPRLQFASDVDGDRHVICLTDESLQGWAVLVRSSSQSEPDERPLEEKRAYGGGTINLIGFGEPTTVWAALVNHEEHLVALRDAEGNVHFP